MTVILKLQAYVRHEKAISGSRAEHVIFMTSMFYTRP